MLLRVLQQLLLQRDVIDSLVVAVVVETGADSFATMEASLSCGTIVIIQPEQWSLRCDA